MFSIIIYEERNTQHTLSSPAISSSASFCSSHTPSRSTSHSAPRSPSGEAAAPVFKSVNNNFIYYLLYLLIDLISFFFINYKINIKILNHIIHFQIQMIHYYIIFHHHLLYILHHHLIVQQQ